MQALSYQLPDCDDPFYMMTKAQHIPCHTILLLSVYILKFLCEAGVKPHADVIIDESAKKAINTRVKTVKESCSSLDIHLF